MKYTVVWKAKADHKLTALWLGSRFRQSITQAAHAIDRELANDAPDCGESRDRGMRVLIVSPLGIYFRVSLADRIASVLDVWKVESHRGHT